MEEYTLAIPTLFPLEFTFANYSFLLANFDAFGQFFLNSMIVSIVIPILQTIVCLPASYALARLNFPGKNFIFFLFLAAMMLPGQLTIIHNYSTIVNLKLMNNLGSLVLLGIYSGSCIFLMKQFFMTLPKELEEAAKIDGCNPFQSFLYVVAPLSLPIISTNFILCFNGVWGDFFTPMLLLKKREAMTLPIGLNIIMGQLGNSSPNILLAALTMTCIPVIIIFFIFRKKLIGGIASTGLKM